MPSVEAYKAVLPGVNQNLIKILIAHYHAPNRTMSATQLANAVGYENYQAINLQYGKLGYEIGIALRYTPSESYQDGTPIWTWVLATGRDPDGGGDWEWTLRPELAQALEGLGWV